MLILVAIADRRTAQAARDLGLFLVGQGAAADARGALAEAVRDGMSGRWERVIQ